MAEEEHPTTGDFIMLRWIANWAVHHAVTPEKQAEKALPQLRLELYQAEQRILDAQMHADYYRARLAFCEEVIKTVSSRWPTSAKINRRRHRRRGLDSSSQRLSSASIRGNPAATGRSIRNAAPAYAALRMWPIGADVTRRTSSGRRRRSTTDGSRA